MEKLQNWYGLHNIYNTKDGMHKAIATPCGPFAEDYLFFKWVIISWLFEQSWTFKRNPQTYILDIINISKNVNDS